MKKIFLYLAALTAVAVACRKVDIEPQEEIDPEPEVEMVTETITGGRDVSTKVTIDNTSGAFAWTATNDLVAVHVSTGEYVTSAGASASAKSATFDVTYPAGATRDAFAVYPSSIVAADAENYGQTGHTLDVTLPSSYTLAQVSDETSPCPMIATNDPGSSEWSFKQLCGLLRLTVNKIPPSAKRLEIDFDGKKVCGDFSIASPNPGTSKIETAADPSHDIITITKDGSDVTLNNGAWLDELVVNIPLPTGDYTNITVTAYDALSGGNAVHTKTDAFGYTAKLAKATKRTTNFPVFDLATASFDNNTIPCAYIYQSNAGTATSNTITIADGQKVVLGGVNMLAGGNAINCVGNAEIVLNGTNYVRSSNSADNTKALIKAGTYEPTKTTLTISGSGTLDMAMYNKDNSNGSHTGAFIGSDKNGDCGNITITGGTIKINPYIQSIGNSTACSNGALIGAGSAYSGTSRCGNITITGGTVTVDTHKSGGACIGSGTSENDSGYSTCGTITISGGVVTAQSWEGGAAIGSGRASFTTNTTYNGYSRCEGIIIEGTANVTARSTANSSTTSSAYAGAAIGAGHCARVGNITISGGTVTATMSDYFAPGIGSGKTRSTCGNITINGGTVEATGGQKAAGIGTGYGAYGLVSTCGTITITTGVTQVKATMGYQGKHSIGAGGYNNNANQVSCGTVTIGGSTGQISTSPYTYPTP